MASSNIGLALPSPPIGVSYHNKLFPTTEEIMLSPSQYTISFAIGEAGKSNTSKTNSWKGRHISLMGTGSNLAYT